MVCSLARYQLIPYMPNVPYNRSYPLCKGWLIMGISGHPCEATVPGNTSSVLLQHLLICNPRYTHTSLLMLRSGPASRLTSSDCYETLIRKTASSCRHFPQVPFPHFCIYTHTQSLDLLVPNIMCNAYFQVAWGPPPSAAARMFPSVPSKPSPQAWAVLLRKPSVPVCCTADRQAQLHHSRNTKCFCLYATLVGGMYHRS